MAAQRYVARNRHVKLRCLPKRRKLCPRAYGRHPEGMGGPAFDLESEGARH